MPPPNDRPPPARPHPRRTSPWPTVVVGRPVRRADAATRRVRRWAAAGALAVVATLAAVAGAALRARAAAHTAHAWVTHTERVLATVDRLELAVVDAETGHRGYLLTGRAAYRAPYDGARGRVADALRRLRDSTADNPSQRARFAHVAALAAATLTEFDTAVALVAAGRDSAARAALDGGRAMRLMADLRRQFAAARLEERRLLAARAAVAEQAAAAVRERVLTGVALGCAVALLVFAAVARGALRLARTSAALDASHRSLEESEAQLRLVQQVTHALSDAASVDEALETALTQMCAAAELPYGESWIPEPAGGAEGAPRLVRGPVWHAAADASLAAFAEASQAFSFARGEGLPGRAWAAAAPTWITIDEATNAAEFPRLLVARSAQVRSALSVPVLADGELVTVLTFFARDPRPIEASRAAQLAAVAAQAGAVVRRKQARAALERERRFLAGVLDSLSENVSVCAPDGRLALFNRATRETHGVPVDADLPPERWSAHYAVYAPDGVTPLPTEALPHVRVLAKREPALDVEFVVRVPGRPPRTLVANAHPLLGPGGEFLGSVCAARDVTAERAAGEEARQGAARLALIYDSASDLMFLMRVGEPDPTGRVPYTCESVNSAYLEVTGMDRGQLLGADVDEILPPAAAAFVRAKYDEAARTGDVLRYEEVAELPTGRLVVETTLTPVFDDAGRCTHLLGAARDVTARQRAEAATRETEARFRGVLENLRAYAVQLDAAGRVTFANDALLAATGWARGEVVGRDYFARFVPDAPEVRGAFEAAVVAGRADELPAHYENAVLTRGGERRLVAWDNVVLRDADGRAAGTASVGRDVTDERRLAAERERLVRALAEQAEHDELTGLVNRRGFQRMAAQERRGAARTARRDAVLCVDLDRFKPINDTHGHAAGDEALRAVARVLRETIRGADFAARLGGDEFAVYAVGITRAGEAAQLSARLHAALDAHNRAARAAGRPFDVGFSIGVAEVDPGTPLEAALAAADARLYAAKRAGRAGAAEYAVR